jgi:dTDP-4-dehydrorhamnose 3,5-epimerase
MKFRDAPLRGAYVIEPEKKSDDRGFFARIFCEQELAGQGLVSHFVQANNSLSLKRGTLRGLHYQLPPAAEVKIVRCVRGAIYDLILDLRADSPTFGKYFGETLTAENRLMMYVPRGFAHGTLALEDDTEILYFVSNFYDADRERSIRFDDPKFGIEWPITPSVISDKDRGVRGFDPAWHGIEHLRNIR